MKHIIISVGVYWWYMCYIHRVSLFISQNAVLLQDLLNSRSQVEAQMSEVQKKRQMAEQQVANLLEDKKALLVIIQQLSLEAAKPLI